MKFLSIYKHAERNAPPSQEEMARMGKLVEEGMKAGWLLGTEGCLPERTGGAGAQFERKPDGDRRAFYRGEGTRRRVRHPASKLQGRGHPIDERFPKGGGRGRVRTSAAL